MNFFHVYKHFRVLGETYSPRFSYGQWGTTNNYQTPLPLAEPLAPLLPFPSPPTRAQSPLTAFPSGGHAHVGLAVAGAQLELAAVVVGVAVGAADGLVPARAPVRTRAGGPSVGTQPALAAERAARVGT